MNSFPRYRYALLLLWTVLITQRLQAQNGQNPYRTFSGYQGYMYGTAKAEIKAGRPVKSLILNDYDKSWLDSLGQFKELERVSLTLSNVTVFQLSAVFEQLARVPTLSTLTLHRYVVKSQDTVIIPRSFAKLNTLENLSIQTNEGVDLSAVWEALPQFERLKVLEVEFSQKQVGFPAGLRKCKNLKSLTVTMPAGMSLPAEIGELKSLDYLTLQGKYHENGAKPLIDPQFLPGFTSLKGLVVSSFRIQGTDLKGLGESLQSIGLYYCTISEPDELIKSLNRCRILASFRLQNLTLSPFSAAAKLELPNLKELFFSDLYEDSLRKKPIAGVPDFSASTQLKVLHLERVLGESLPKGLDQLTELETLHLAGNQLTQLPDLGRMTKLRMIVVNNNQLKELPKGIAKAQKLRGLNAANNQLSELPPGLFNASELEFVFLANNHLEKLPADFSKLQKLKDLNISGNQLTELPKNIGSGGNLQNLQLSNNELTALPNSIGQLKRLKSLDVSHNPLTQLPESLSDCDSLERLVLSNCRLETLPNSLGKLQHLNFLNLADADMVYVNRTSMEGRVEQLPAKNHNQLRSLPASLAHCRKLVNLELSRNKYWEEKDLWPVIQQLRIPQGTVNLAECNLSAVPMTGWLDTQIQNLYLVKNELTQFPTEWYKAKGIKSIVLFQNKLTPPAMNQEFRSFEERLLLGEEMGVDVPKPFPKTKEMARAYLNQAGKKVNTGDIPRFVEYMKEVQRIDSTEGKYAIELWSRFYFHTHQYRRAIDSMNVVINRYFNYEKERPKREGQPQQRGLPVALYVDLRGQSKWKLGDSLGAIKDYELLVNDYKLFAPNLWGRLGVWYKRYRPTTGKSGAAFDKAINMYEAVQNQPPMVQLSAAEVYFMNDQADKAYEYLFGLDRTKFKPEENRLADYLLLAAQVAQKQAGEEEVETFEKRLKSDKLKIQGWSYQLFEEALNSLDYPTEQKALLRRLTASLKAQSVLVD
ncbi:leucine-rich repeat domain-containing protein [Runella slithyformis]|uniref:Adenylate cyclase n=1 Tax=Runella slithyformis (strain ATCC 29530 / DSM 19594 / LMG 11500 / NCIMB 11436 / LSU 4) TaxID=761193 RepID=A0A7U3ZKV0_RUNSL|nr:leucine-rich repeat domain-containing protein [Runella slithyformis]AEI49012.1 Adenylate cyclase [Runella slithyformis DSM 19594]